MIKLIFFHSKLTNVYLMGIELRPNEWYPQGQHDHTYEIKVIIVMCYIFS